MLGELRSACGNEEEALSILELPAACWAGDHDLWMLDSGLGSQQGPRQGGPREVCFPGSLHQAQCPLQALSLALTWTHPVTWLQQHRCVQVLLGHCKHPVQESRSAQEAKRASVFFHVVHFPFTAMACRPLASCLQAATIRSLSSSAAASLRGWSWRSCKHGRAARRAACWRTYRLPAGPAQPTTGRWHMC